MTALNTANPPAVENPGPADPGTTPKDPAALEAHARQLLDEKKREKARADLLAAEIAEMKRKEAAREEARLREQNDFKALAESKEKENQTLKSELETRKAHELDSRKLHAVLKAIGVPIDNKFWGLVPTDAVKASDTGEIDQDSAKAIADQMKREYPEILPNPNGGRGTGLANDPPKGGGSAKLSPEEFHKLPPTEQRRRYSEVDWKTK